MAANVSMIRYPRGTIWPASDEDSVQIREVYSRCGLAMYQAQVLEHGMVNAVIVARMLETLELPDELIGRLRVAKTKRDRLAHRFFREHDEDFLVRSGRTVMIAECEDAIEMFTAIDADLEEHMRPQRERHGITSKWIEGHLAVAIATAEARGSCDGPGHSPTMGSGS